ncbi:MAG: BMP family ABC transporter substrate-binding protein, partial [bacterium]|nr:BMP family ABC transporter substrate-binding protein [bacterium]
MRMKTRLLSVLAAFALLAAACGGEEEPGTTATQASSETPEATQPPTGEPIKIGLVYDIGGRGDQSFNDAAAAGLDRAATELGIEFSEASANEDGTNRE